MVPDLKRLRLSSIDSIEADTLNGVVWVVTPRDAPSSEPPGQLVLVRRTATGIDTYEMNRNLLLDDGPRRLLLLDPLLQLRDRAAPLGALRLGLGAP